MIPKIFIFFAFFSYCFLSPMELSFPIKGDQSQIMLLVWDELRSLFPVVNYPQSSTWVANSLASRNLAVFIAFSQKWM